MVVGNAGRSSRACWRRAADRERAGAALHLGCRRRRACRDLRPVHARARLGATARPRRSPPAPPRSPPRPRPGRGRAGRLRPASAPRRPASPSPPGRAWSSCARSTGTCSRLHEGATISRRVATPVGDAPQHGKRRAQVGAPDVAPVHHAERQPLLRRAPLQARRRARRRPRARSRCSPATGSRTAVREIVAQRAEIAGQQELRRRALGERAIGGASAARAFCGRSSARHGSSICTQAAARLRQLAQHVRLDRQHAVEQVQRIGAVRGFGQQQEADRAEQHGPGADARSPVPRGTARAGGSRSARNAARRRGAARDNGSWCRTTWSSRAPAGRARCPPPARRRYRANRGPARNSWRA